MLLESRKERRMKVYLLTSVLCIIAFTLGCQPKQFVQRKAGYRKHTIQMKDLDQTYLPFQSTEFDLFNPDHTVRRQTQSPPTYIHYYTFKIKPIDEINQKVANLYAQYQFMSFSLKHFELIIKKLTGKHSSLVKEEEIRSLLTHHQTKNTGLYQKLNRTYQAFQKAHQVSLFVVKEGQIAKRQAYRAYLDDSSNTPSRSNFAWHTC